MLKKQPYQASLIALVILALVCIWQINAGTSPLVAWVFLILAHIGVMAIFFVRHKASVHSKVAIPSPSANEPASLVQSIEYINEHSDTTGQPTPRLPAGLSSVAGSRSSALATQVRAYASVDDAQSYGWVFSQKVGVFQDSPIFQKATLEGKVWEYDGLASEVLTASVPADRRVFGQLRYKQSNDDAVSPTSEAIIQEKSGSKSSISEDNGINTDVQGVKAS